MILQKHLKVFIQHNVMGIMNYQENMWINYHLNEFKVFLERYNHSIRFINEEMNEESIEIFDNIIEDPDLIEPYVILILLYEKVGNIKKKENY